MVRVGSRSWTPFASACSIVDKHDGLCLPLGTAVVEGPMHHCQGPIASTCHGMSLLCFQIGFRRVLNHMQAHSRRVGKLIPTKVTHDQQFQNTFHIIVQRLPCKIKPQLPTVIVLVHSGGYTSKIPGTG